MTPHVPTASTSAEVSAQRNAADLVRANGRLADDRAFYCDLRARHGAEDCDKD